LKGEHYDTPPSGLWSVVKAFLPCATKFGIVTRVDITQQPLYNVLIRRKKAMSRTFSVRVDDDVFNELEVLARATGQSKNAVVNNLIRAEYDKYDSDPKVKLAIKQLKELQETFERFEAEAKSVKA